MHYASMQPKLVATCGRSLSLSSALPLSPNSSACTKMPRSAGSFYAYPRRAARRSYRCSTSMPPSSPRTRACATEELVYDEALGLVPEGEGVKLLIDGSTVSTGRIPVNSRGGLISMGHPIGPTGLGQIAEILWQMRRTAGLRQIPQDVHVAVARLVGAGGVWVIHF